MLTIGQSWKTSRGCSKAMINLFVAVCVFKTVASLIVITQQSFFLNKQRIS